MSSQIRDAIQAIDVAHKVAEKAGLAFYVAESARRQGDYWLVRLVSLLGTYKVKINSLNGEVVEFAREE